MAEGTSGNVKAKKGKAPTKTPEQRKQERRDRFVRLAPKRVNAALRVIGYVENLGNKAGYEYTIDEADKIVAALKKAVDKVTEALADESPAQAAFTL